MPPPRLGRTPLGEDDLDLFSPEDPWGWRVSEIEEEYELKPGLRRLAEHIVSALMKLSEGGPEHRLAGHRGRNLKDNPYWPPELAAAAGRLPHERYVILLSLALSRTQDDKGRVRWTLFGSSEQGPERAFWQGFYSAPGREMKERESLGFLARLLSGALGEPVPGPASLSPAGFRILPSEPDPRFRYWHEPVLPSWTRPFVVEGTSSFEGVRYLLTFQPFSRLPAAVRERYLAGKLVLLPSPGSLLFWGQQSYVRLQGQLPLAMQLPLLRFVSRHGAPGGLRIPQTGWFHEPGSGKKPSEIHPELLVNTYRRTSRWDRVHRHEDDVALSAIEDKIGKVFFSTEPEAMGLYNKPMARNCQIWTEDARLVLDGPNAAPAQIFTAAAEVAAGGSFAYRFQFPAMRVGKREVYWHRPLVAYWSAEKSAVEVMTDAPPGCLYAYEANSPDPANPVILWPRLLRRETYLSALESFDHLKGHFAHQTAHNILALLDSFRLGGGRPLSRDFAGNLLRLAEDKKLDDWPKALPGQAPETASGKRLRQELEGLIEPLSTPHGDSGEERSTGDIGEALTYGETATRAFEERIWKDIAALSHGRYLNKDNADLAQDPLTLSALRHHHRDLEALGDYLLGRHSQAVAEAGMEGRALSGEIPFHWKTDFPFDLFGGWFDNQSGRTHERDLIVTIPGKNRREAVVLADHYDTAYMEDLYDKSRGGTGIRMAAAGADDNHSATATLLQAAPVFLKLAREGRLERDVWLLHLTGEEFPADCMGARHFCQALVEGTLKMKSNQGSLTDLSAVRIAGVFVMDMIAHNRESGPDVFQISPGRGARALRLARLAHRANMTWNARAKESNRTGDRQRLARGLRSPNPDRIPDVALYAVLRGEVRTSDDPRSSLYNTDGQIFSDVGVPVVLFMENYDINRKGYHDTHDTMENIDLDYGAALAAIAIETVAQAATEKSL